MKTSVKQLILYSCKPFKYVLNFLTSMVLPSESQDSIDPSALLRALVHSERTAWGISEKKKKKGSYVI